MSAPLRQIISISSGFNYEPGQPSFLPYMLAATGKENPSILFIPTATADSDGSIVSFYENSLRLDCRPSYLSLFRQPKDMANLVASADIIYVNGGNTRNMLALWRASGLDVLLLKAWENGTVLSGMSAGGICWFEDAQTTSGGQPGPISCLGFLSGSCSTHFDSNKDRPPHLRQAIGEGSISPGYALSDNTGLHFHGTELHAAIACEAGRKVYQFAQNPDGTVAETELQTQLVGPAAINA